MRKKGVTVTLFIFILLSAVLAVSGTKMVVELVRSVNHLFVQSETPHFVQMHAGTLDAAQVDAWAAADGRVEKHQIEAMLNLDGASVYMGGESEQSSVMDISFVEQNRDFDFLLDLSGNPVEVGAGEIGVPVYYMQQRGLKIGDAVTVDTGAFSREYKIAAFVRDSQMNPSIVHSKRFVVAGEDYEALKPYAAGTEYLIEFRLRDAGQIGQFASDYQGSDLPKTGPSVDYSLFKLLNALTDGIVAAVVILVSLVLNVIAILCIRFTMLATIEEDYREIGVMKAIGISHKDIKRLYLVKYVFLAASASLLGYAISFGVLRYFMSNIMLYIGNAPSSPVPSLLGLLGAALIFGMVVLFSNIVLRRFRGVSAVEALRSGSLGDAKPGKRRMSLNRAGWMRIPVLLGFQDVAQRFKLFRLLLFVFIVSSFIIIVPVNFLNTIQAPGFVSYMGIGRSDIRIDLQHSDNVEDRYKQLVEQVSADPDVSAFSPLVTSQFKVLNEEGSYDNLSVETGDFSVFPLDYVSGSAPANGDQIALSYVNSDEMGKKAGDTLTLFVDGENKKMTISGIYQDVTNGGRTAKALLPYNADAVLWYVVSLDVRDAGLIPAKIAKYEQDFQPAKVTDLQGYLDQTLGGTVNQLKMVTGLATGIAVFVAILITSLFLQMLISKDRNQIAILRSIGFGLDQIKVKYITMALILLVAGIVLGTVLSNTAGQWLVSAIMSFFGASRISFVINPIVSYLLCPLLLAVCVGVTALLSIKSVKEANISRMIAE
ncbi:FtsX-like permease family protein [Saccharibacillus sp. CPCC 101409]|uniref:ABC transporter permease n=1 Tax=Saccharibacillus sp. CPCC 101409 TaxID=3058041 RepID=UPI00267390B7|nr:ABC transporter permease [Saccharibacillus sp. CPCC 101409]MDO3410489.1 FtsX-like permease family protein [Saccharibacillus sp. CPCC 101409]